MPFVMKLYIASDHAGFERKEMLKRYLDALGYELTDFGPHDFNPHDDYPDFAYPLAQAVAKDGVRGLLLCGNAEGVCIVANKVDGVRAALGYSETAVKTSRQDDDSNVLCLPGREFSDEEIKRMALAWIKTEFSNAERHKRRLKKIERIEYEN